MWSLYGVIFVILGQKQARINSRKSLIRIKLLNTIWQQTRNYILRTLTDIVSCHEHKDVITMSETWYYTLYSREAVGASSLEVGVQAHAGRGPGQSELVLGNRAHSRGMGTGLSLRSLLTQAIIWFWDS